MSCFWINIEMRKNKSTEMMLRRRETALFLRRGREDSDNVNNEETVSFRLREAEILSIRRRKTGSDNCVSFTTVNHKVWSLKWLQEWRDPAIV